MQRGKGIGGLPFVFVLGKVEGVGLSGGIVVGESSQNVVRIKLWKSFLAWESLNGNNDSLKRAWRDIKTRLVVGSK